jgi:hypothetical protein
LNSTRTLGSHQDRGSVWPPVTIPPPSGSLAGRTLPKASYALCGHRRRP